MDVLPAAEGGDHRLIVCDVRKQAQLDLAVVRVHEHLAGRGHEHLADLRAELAAHGDILQVRLSRRQAPRRRDGHLEVRVDAPVGRDLLEQPVGIGGLELRERAVIEDLLDDRVLAAQLVEHGGIRAPAGLGLFPGRKHEPLEENSAELLRRLDVERLARERPDALLELLDAAREALAEVVQRLAVDQKARLLHARQHRTQRQLNVRKERQHSLRVHFLLQHRLQRPDGLHVRQLLAKIRLREPRQVVASGRGVEQVGRQRRVEHEAVRRQSLVEQRAHEVFDVVPRLAHARGKQQAQKCVVAVAELRPRERIARLAVAERERVEPVGCKHCDTGRRRDRLLERVQRGAVRHVHGRQRARRCARAVRRLQAPLFRQRREVKPPEPVVQLRLIVVIPDGRLERKVDRRVRADGGEVERELRALAPLGKLSAHAGLDVQRIEVAVNVRHRAEAHEQILRRLFADAGYAGDVVGAVAHERLEVDHPDGIKAVFFTKALGRVFDRIRLPHAGLDVKDMGAVCNELQAVLVAGDDVARPAGALAAARDRAGRRPPSRPAPAAARPYSRASA